MKTTTETTIQDASVMNLCHFEWDDQLYIELDNEDSIKVTCDPQTYIMLFRNLLCAKSPVIKKDCEGLKDYYISSLKEIKEKLNAMDALN